MEMDDDDDEFRYLELRIRTLTTVLSQLMPPSFTHEPLETVNISKPGPLTMLCNHVSVLLKTSSSIDTAAVAPVSYTVSGGLVLLGVTREKRSPNVSRAPTMNGADVNNRENDAYVQHLLDAFHPNAPEDRFDTLIPIVIEHCRLKIAQTLSLWDTFFSVRLEEAIGECDRTDNTVWATHITVPDAVAHLLNGISHRDAAPGLKDFRLASDNIWQWTIVISTQLMHLRASLIDHVFDVSHSRCLYFFLASVVCNDVLLETIFVRTDLLNHLTEHYRSPLFHEDANLIESFSELGDYIVDSEAFRRLSVHEQVTRLARACLALVASWRRAIIHLIITHRMSGFNVDMTFMSIQPPTPDDEMEDVGLLLRSLGILPVLNDDGEVKDRKLRALMNSKTFTGTVHNEALIMALKKNPEEAATDSQVRLLLSDVGSDRSVGFAAKPCLCCHMVADELNIKLPGSNGRIVPWSPPKGLPINLLYRISHVLSGKLEVILC